MKHITNETELKEPQVWLKTSDEKLRSLLADEAKGQAMLTDISNTIRQLRAKSSFRIALINQLIESENEKINKD